MGLISNGTTIFDNGTVNAGGSLKFISKATASASASIEFTSGIDSTYKEYVFYFVNMHPSTNNIDFQFNLSTDGGSNYNVSKTTTYFRTYHYENGTISNLEYSSDKDLANGTGEQQISDNSGASDDEAISGYLHLFNPSSTTFVKHFLSETNSYSHDDASERGFVGGYANTTSAINAIRFKFASGNIDAGEILLFGVN
jgi:hypothetical protein